MQVSPLDRAASLERLGSETFDVLVIGGGITGVGVALDAATRGLRTALVERDDFASGTSSKSSKLVHGGLRYLQQGEIRLVYEALRERQRLCKNAPHLVRMLPFMIPILTKDGVVSRKIARALGSAMWMYDLTGGAADRQVPPPTEGRRGLRPPADDAPRAARVGLPVLRRHRRRCPARASPWPAPRSRTARSSPTGARSSGSPKDAERLRRRRRGRGRRPAIHDPGPVVVNATGVWADEIRTLDEGHDPDSIRPAKGIHVTVPWSKVRNDIAVVIPVPKDKRSLFVVPWGAAPDGTFEHTYVGTTDTDYDGPLDDPQCTARRPRLRASARSMPRSPPASPSTTSPACGPGCARW